MVQIILAILYISLVCWGWGFTALRYINRSAADAGTPAILLCCFFGLSLIGIVSQALSVFMPVGGWPVQVFLLLPALILMIRTPGEITGLLKHFQHWLATLNTPARIFLFSGMLFIVLVGTWHITNPDTIGYHAPIIKWNELYKATPGIANLNGRLGLQSSWFILCALFDFSFTGTPAITFINSAVLTWLVFFLAGILSQHYPAGTGNVKLFFLWLVLCIICFGVNVQAYLMASSASPDFAICIFLWACFYLVLLQREGSQTNSTGIVALFLLAFAISLKLSALPALLILPVIFLKLTSFRPSQRILLLVGVPAIAIIPFLYRNIIISGYPLFPSMYFNLFTVDWKADPAMTRQIEAYIAVFAKTGFVTLDDFINGGDPPFQQWFPVWLKQYTPAEIILTFSAFISAVVNLLYVRYYLQRKHQILGWIIGICIVSSILLFIKAPAPRFSQAFLVPVILAALNILLEKFPRLNPKPRMQQVMVILLLLPMLGYSAHRLYHYFDAENIWRPYGISETQVNTIECQGMKINLPVDPAGCGNAAIPCANNACITFFPRGTTLQDGFKSSKK